MHHYKHAQQEIRREGTIIDMPNSQSGKNAPLQACPTVEQVEMYHYKHAQQEIRRECTIASMINKWCISS
jgi:hypothetical protein